MEQNTTKPLKYKEVDSALEVNKFIEKGYRLLNAKEKNGKIILVMINN